MTELSKCVVARSAGNLTPASYLDLVSRLIQSLKLCGSRELSGSEVLVKTDFSADGDGNFRIPPLLVRAVAEYFLDLGAAVKIGDSPLSSCMGDCGAAQRDRLSMELADLDVEWVSFEAARTVPRVTKHRVFFVSESAMSVDLLVNLASFRDDLFCRPHGAMVNLLGLLPGYQKVDHLMRDPGGDGVNRLIVDLLAAVSPALSIICAPPQRRSHENDAVIGVSQDTVALDTLFSCILTGSDRDPAPLIHLAAEAGLGLGWPELIEMQQLNADLEDLATAPVQADSRPTTWPSSATNLVSGFIWARPKIQLPGCRPDCTACSGVCPTEALHHHSHDRIRLREDRCIGCWRCREGCPDGLISVERSPILNRMLSQGAISAPR